MFNDSSIIKNKAHIDLKDRNITNARYNQVNQLPQIDSHLKAKLYVDNASDQESLVRTFQVNDFIIFNLTNINSIALDKQAENDNEVITKAYVDQFHSDIETNRRHVGLSFYKEKIDLIKNNQDNDFNDNELTNLDSITVNRNPSLYNELANKKYVDDSLGGDKILSFNQTLENYLKVSIDNDIYNLNKYDKIQLTDSTMIKAPNNGGYFLLNGVIKNNDEKNNGKLSNFIKTIKTNSPTGGSGATSLLPIGDSFMKIETSSSFNGDNVFCSFEQTDIIQISNITFCYNRF